MYPFGKNAVGNGNPCDHTKTSRKPLQGEILHIVIPYLQPYKILKGRTLYGGHI